MQYRQLGKAGIKVSALSLGAWLTFGTNLDLAKVRQCIRWAFDQGVNFFDNAEAYGNGVGELMMGQAIREYPREELVIATKIFWGGKSPNATGLSWKHLVEGTKNSLRRLQLDYVDLLYCHSTDPHTPIEETVRAMDYLIRSGLVFYWGTSDWKKKDIETAYQIAKEIHAIPPSMEQPEYHLFHRERVEKEYQSLYEKYGMGTTIWSPLASGILTGKYNEGIPAGTRLDLHPELRDQLTPAKIEKVKKLAKVAKDLGCTLAQLSIAWCLKNPNVSSVIMGISNSQQLKDNMKAIDVERLLVSNVMQAIEAILAGN